MDYLLATRDAGVKKKCRADGGSEPSYLFLSLSWQVVARLFSPANGRRYRDVLVRIQCSGVSFSRIFDWLHLQ